MEVDAVIFKETGNLAKVAAISEAVVSELDVTTFFDDYEDLISDVVATLRASGYGYSREEIVGALALLAARDEVTAED